MQIPAIAPRLIMPEIAKLTAPLRVDDSCAMVVVTVLVWGERVVPGIVVAGFVVPGATVLPLTILGAKV